MRLNKPKSTTDADIRRDLLNLYEDATRYKQANGKYPTNVILMATFLPWLQQQGVDLDERYPNDILSYTFTQTASEQDAWAESPYLLFDVRLGSNSTDMLLTVTNTGEIVSDTFWSLRDRAFNEYMQASSRNPDSRITTTGTEKTAQPTPSKPSTPSASSTPPNPAENVPPTDEVRKELQSRYNEAVAYKRSKGRYPPTALESHNWFVQQDRDSLGKYPPMDGITPTASMDKWATSPYILFISQYERISFSRSTPNVRWAMTNTGKIVSDESRSLEARVARELAAAGDRQRKEQREAQDRQHAKETQQTIQTIVTLSEAEIRQDLERIHKDAIRYKKTEGRYPWDVNSIVGWLKKQGEDTLQRYPGSDNKDNRFSRYYFSSVSRYTMAPAAVESVSPYILVHASYVKDKDDDGRSWAITDTGEIVSDSQANLQKRSSDEMAAASQRDREERSAQLASGSQPAWPAAPNMNRFTQKPDAERKFPHKAIPIGVSDADKARLHLENLWADLQEYREDNDGKLPARLMDLTPRYTDFSGVRSPRSNWEYTYNPTMPEQGLEVLAAEPEDRVWASSRQPQPPKVYLALLSNGTIVQGSSQEAIRKQYVAGGTDDVGIAWRITGWSPAEFDKVPFGKACRILLFTDNGGGCYAGLDVGPAARDLTAETYTDYRDAAKETLKEIAPAGATVREVANTKVNGVAYHRYITEHRASGKMITVLTGVEKGRCVAYWFFGLPKSYGVFQAAIGKATIQATTTKPATTQPTTRAGQK